jgi:superfamily II DNA helicase RecQ
MKGEQPPPASLIDIVPQRRESAPRKVAFEPTDESWSPDASERFERLRAVRMELAKDRQLPPYCICHDTTLKLIALNPPSDVVGLETIKGMGPYKVKMYGEALLRALS